MRRSPRDDFKVADPRESGQDFLLNAVGKISVRLVFTQIFKRQDRDRFAQSRRARLDLFLALFIFFKFFRRLRIANLIRVEVNEGKRCAVFYFARA